MLRHLLAGRSGSTISGKGPPRSGRPFPCHVQPFNRWRPVCTTLPMFHSQRHAARGLQTFLGRAVLGVRRLGPAVHAGHGDRPALLILHGAHAAAGWGSPAIQYQKSGPCTSSYGSGWAQYSAYSGERQEKYPPPLPCKTPRHRKVPGRFAPVTEWRWRCSWAAASSHSWARRWSGCHPQTWR